MLVLACMGACMEVCRSAHAGEILQCLPSTELCFSNKTVSHFMNAEGHEKHILNVTE